MPNPGDCARLVLPGEALSRLEAARVETLDAWTREDVAANRWYRSHGFSEQYRYLHVYLNDGDDDAGFMTVRANLEAAGIKYSSAEITMIPQTMVALEGKQAESMLRLMDKLEDNDDVQNVYSNFDISADEMEKMM